MKKNLLVLALLSLTTVGSALHAGYKAAPAADDKKEMMDYEEMDVDMEEEDTDADEEAK